MVKSRRVDGRLLVGGSSPSERCPEPGKELVHAEGLGDVVVGAGIEGGDLVGLALADAEDDDRHARPTAEAVDDVDAVEAGKAEVEDDEVGMSALRRA